MEKPIPRNRVREKSGPNFVLLEAINQKISCVCVCLCVRNIAKPRAYWSEIPDAHSIEAKDAKQRSSEPDGETSKARERERNVKKKKEQRSGPRRNSSANRLVESSSSRLSVFSLERLP